MTPKYGRAPRANRVSEYVPDARYERTSVIATTRLKGKSVSLMFKGALNGEWFARFVKEMLAPSLKKGDILILDNLSVHKTAGALTPIYEKGASVVFLPPYSPDLNPIELCWSKMKTIVRKQKPQTYDELVFAMKMAIESIAKVNVKNWFRHCNYRCQ